MTWQRSSGRTTPLPANWAMLRAAQLLRDGHTCVKCGAEATDVDHYGDPDDHTRLRSLCRTCHNKRTSAQGHAAKGHGPTRYRPPEPHPGAA